MSDNSEIAAALDAEIAQLRAEREAYNLDIEDRRVKVRRLSQQIRDKEAERAGIK